MIRLVHTADWHLGAPRVPPDVFELALNALVAYYHDNSANLILCVGDVFDKAKPAQRTKDQLLDFLLNNEDINFIFTLGNHDYEDKNHKYDSLKTLNILTKNKKLKNVRILEPGGGIKFKGANIYACESWDDLYKKRKADIVTYHGMPPQETFLSKDFKKKMAEHELDILKSSTASYVALGDIHKTAKPYPGALIQKTYSCEAGILAFDLATKTVVTESLAIPAKEIIDFSKLDDISDSEIISALEKRKEGNWVKIITQLPLSKYLGIDKATIKGQFDKKFREIMFFNKPVAERLKREYPKKLRKTKTLKDDCNVLIDEDKDIEHPDKIKAICSEYATKVE